MRKGLATWAAAILHKTALVCIMNGNLTNVCKVCMYDSFSRPCKSRSGESGPEIQGRFVTYRQTLA